MNAWLMEQLAAERIAEQHRAAARARLARTARSARPSHRALPAMGRAAGRGSGLVGSTLGRVVPRRSGHAIGCEA